MTNRIVVFAFIITLLLPLAAWSQASSTAPDAFALKDGDRVVFFGDSITEQRQYTKYVEQYAITRFPDRRFTFIMSGVGGDKVSGGWAGPIDQRLRRDVFAYDPTTITVMLGMNDGYYRAFDEGILSTYEQGYRHILDSFATHAPSARLTLIKPSPFDDVTRDPQFDGGYNSVMLRFSDVVATLASEKRANVADMNTPVVAALTKAKAADPSLAITLMFDRVHPGGGIHWIMADALLKSWNAPAIVTSVTIDADKATVSTADNTEVAQLKKTKKDGALTWIQNDRALPLPLPSAASDPITALALKSSTVIDDLDQQVLRVTALKPGNYELRIDDRAIDTFTAEELQKGVNLALLETPMLAQARLVALDTDYRNSLEATRFSLLHSVPTSLVTQAIAKLTQALTAAVDRQYADAKPTAHKYSILPAFAPATAKAAAK